MVYFSHKPLISVQHNFYIIVRQIYSITLGYILYSTLSILILPSSLTFSDCYNNFSSFLNNYCVNRFVKLAIHDA